MSPSSLTVPVQDGRLREAVAEGDPNGSLLVFHHGSPGAAAPFPAFHRAAKERGIRLVHYSRPGFGDSTRLQGRSVASCATDVAILADHLGADRFVTMGWSGGGPHAIACAALLPERVLAAASVAGVAPYDAEGLDWTAGMGEDNQIEYPLAARDREALLRWMTPQAEAMANIAPQEIVDALRSIISDVDEASLSGDLGEVIAKSFHLAFAPRIVGVVRRRPCVRGTVGFRPRVDHRTGVDLARSPRSGGAVRARRMARTPRPGGAIATATGARSPFAGRRKHRRDPRRSHRRFRGLTPDPRGQWRFVGENLDTT